MWSGPGNISQTSFSIGDIVKLREPENEPCRENGGAERSKLKVTSADIHNVDVTLALLTDNSVTKGQPSSEPVNVGDMNWSTAQCKHSPGSQLHQHTKSQNELHKFVNIEIQKCVSNESSSVEDQQCIDPGQTDGDLALPSLSHPVHNKQQQTPQHHNSITVMSQTSDIHHSSSEIHHSSSEMCDRSSEIHHSSEARHSLSDTKIEDKIEGDEAGKTAVTSVAGVENDSENEAFDSDIVSVSPVSSEGDIDCEQQNEIGDKVKVKEVEGQNHESGSKTTVVAAARHENGATITDQRTIKTQAEDHGENSMTEVQSVKYLNESIDIICLSPVSSTDNGDGSSLTENNNSPVCHFEHELGVGESRSATGNTTPLRNAQFPMPSLGSKLVSSAKPNAQILQTEDSPINVCCAEAELSQTQSDAVPQNAASCLDVDDGWLSASQASVFPCNSELPQTMVNEATETAVTDCSRVENADVSGSETMIDPLCVVSVSGEEDGGGCHSGTIHSGVDHLSSKPQESDGNSIQLIESCGSSAVVPMKEEPIDSGYDHAFTAKSRHHPHKPSTLRLKSKQANRHRSKQLQPVLTLSQNVKQHLTKEPEIISTTTRREGTKKVRVTVIRGEWRTPKDTKALEKKKRKKEKIKKAQMGSPHNTLEREVTATEQEPLSDTEQDRQVPLNSQKREDLATPLNGEERRRSRRRSGDIVITVVPPAAARRTLPAAVKVKHSSCRPIGQGGKVRQVTDNNEKDMGSVTVENLSEDSIADASAVPTAMFRNAYVHIKLEPVDDLQAEDIGVVVRDSQRDNNLTVNNGDVSDIDNANYRGDVGDDGNDDNDTSRGQGKDDDDIDILAFINKNAGWRRQRHEPKLCERATMMHQFQRQISAQHTNPQNTQTTGLRRCEVNLERLPADVVTSGPLNVSQHPKLLQEAIRVSTARLLYKRPRDANRPYQCEHCGKCFKQRSHRYSHYKTHMGVKEHHCDLCGKWYMFRTTLNAHIRFQHNKEKPYQCSLCDKKFAYSSHLSVHLQRHYNEKPLNCPICHKQYAAYSISAHMKTHSEKKDFACSLCGAQLKSKTALIIHESVHSGKRPWKCQRCGDTFPYKGSLIIHERMHTGEKPYYCEKCPATFSQSTHLRTHLKGVHKIANPVTRRETRKLVECVPAQSLDNSKKDAILLMRQAMSKAMADHKIYRQVHDASTSQIAAPFTFVDSRKFEGQQTSEDYLSSSRKRSSSGVPSTSNTKSRKHNEGEDVDDGDDDDNELDNANTEERSENVVVKLDFRKGIHVRRK